MKGKILLNGVADIEEMIRKAHELHREREALSERINVLLAPSLTDRALIPVIHGWFADIVSDRDCPPDINSVHQRRKFLFIILLLYDPGFFAGRKMAFGLRRDLAGCTGLKTESTISSSCADMLFIYRQYKDFSTEISRIYEKIVERCRQLPNQ
jgi:hypothetical protein